MLNFSLYRNVSRATKKDFFVLFRPKSDIAVFVCLMLVLSHLIANTWLKHHSIITIAWQHHDVQHQYSIVITRFWHDKVVGIDAFATLSQCFTDWWKKFLTKSKIFFTWKICPFLTLSIPLWPFSTTPQILPNSSADLSSLYEISLLWHRRIIWW